MVCGEHLSDSPGCKQWNVHRGKEHCINLVFQILQSDPDRIKHMSCCIVFVSKKDYIIGGKMALQHMGLKSPIRDDFPAATIKAPVCMIVTSLKALYKIDTIIS